jgi:hypothetical protein
MIYCCIVHSKREGISLKGICYILDISVILDDSGTRGGL